MIGLSGLWRDRDFVRLWGAATVSTFGTLISATALPFAAILVLEASPGELAVLRAAELAPGFVVGLVAGAWVDRLRRRPILIVTDLASASLLVSVAGAALFGVLTLWQLAAVGAGLSVLGTFFDAAYRSYLPSLVDDAELVEGNSKLTAAAAVAEASAFGVGGWLVQALSAPVAILVDAVSYAGSAALIWRIGAAEPTPRGRGGRSGIAAEIGEGLRWIAAVPVLRALAGAKIALNLAYGLGGTVYLLFVNQELGFGPAVLGLMFAVGGVASFVAAVAAGRLGKVPIGPLVVGALALVGLGQGLTPLATGTGLAAVGLLVGQQLVADAAATVFDISSVSLRQAITPGGLLGRVNASVRMLGVGATLVGAGLGAVIGERVGLRQALFAQAGVFVVGAALLWRSPLREVRTMPGGAGVGDATVARG